MRAILVIGFNGKNYHGWQIQPNAHTVQEEINRAVNIFFKDKFIDSMGCGRTDAGVHSSYFPLHINLKDRPHDTQEDIKYKLNAFLPKDIVVYQVIYTTKDLHTRFHAIHRTYEYRVVEEKPLFNISQVYYAKLKLNFQKMNKAASMILGERDFSCFAKSGDAAANKICTVSRAEWVKENNCWVFVISANRFLRNMVRAIVGTLIEIGCGKKEIDYIQLVLDSKERSRAGASVPAKGLSLVDVKYPKPLTSFNE